MLPTSFEGRLRLPILVSPMFLVSGPNLVVESCKAGVIGSFPAFNQRTSDGYEQWLKDVRARVGDNGVPWATQYPVHRTNDRLQADFALTIKYQVPILISTIGITREVTDAVHAYGGLVFHDAINVRHAKKALEANVDGIIAVSGGAGGHSGTYNPFAFLGELKPIMGDKTLILAGCMSDGQAVAGAIAAGADLAYVGTRFVNTVESIASEKLKRLVLESDITDVVYTDQVDGIGSSFLRQTLPGDDFREDLAKGGFNISEILEPKRWVDILSAGQGVGAIDDIPTTAELVDRFEQGYHRAVARLGAVPLMPRVAAAS
ncbi:nitronate monooxygenase [Sphingomonadaceae bacterium G21617-S1]|uniref:NAD(P)H-dependent flavin oxidoreductase n=1 Tax=Rhizorhabdus sp. TaxID=1968843 RepID=UPI0022BD4842|nr:nitronate monooxygenase [Rhizorhabdus sp.]MCZ4341979.1 nitronate monooxygenase [Sphingomonadaceae bacterium G21617-S1]